MSSACSATVNSDGDADAAPADATMPDAELADAEICDDTCLFAKTFETIISYSPADRSADRLTHDMAGDTSTAVLEFRFDESNGSFEWREGGACQPTRDNPDFFQVLIRAKNKDLSGCTVQASWDEQAFECPPIIMDLVNSDDGMGVVLSTDAYKSDPEDLCTFLETQHFPEDSFAWWQATFIVGDRSITKRVNMFKAPMVYRP